MDYLAAQYLTVRTSEVAMTAVADDVTLLQKANGEELAELADRTPFILIPKEKHDE